MNIKNFLKRKKGKIHGSNRKILLSDNKTWMLMLSVFVFINVCIVAFSLYLFLQINNGDIFNIKQNNVVSVETISREVLHDTITSFEKKAKDFDRLKADELGVIDPSL